jgi:hypothetical protein
MAPGGEKTLRRFFIDKREPPIALLTPGMQMVARAKTEPPREDELRRVASYGCSCSGKRWVGKGVRARCSLASSSSSVKGWKTGRRTGHASRCITPKEMS